MNEKEKTFEELLNEIDFSKDYPDDKFLSKIDGICFILYPQFNKEEYSNLTIDQKKTDYDWLVRDKIKKYLDLEDIEKHSNLVNEIIEKYKNEIIAKN